MNVKFYKIMSVCKCAHEHEIEHEKVISVIHMCTSLLLSLNAGMWLCLKKPDLSWTNSKVI